MSEVEASSMAEPVSTQKKKKLWSTEPTRTMSMPCQSHVSDVSEKRKKKRYRLDTGVQRVLPVSVLCQKWRVGAI